MILLDAGELKIDEELHSKKYEFLSAQIEKINDFSQQTEYVVVLGIGGSALGAKCLIQALKPDAKVYILDNIDPNFIKETEQKIDIQKTLFIVVSKSGETIETKKLEEYFRKKTDNFITISDPANNPDFEIPENISGRFSILTPAALLPAKLAGIDIEKIIKGAQSMEDNPLPLKLAKIQYELYKQGKTINVLMPYAQQLTGLADWYRQLLAESIGKKGKGITPVRALGASDQHSQLQLYAEGPDDKLIIFVEVENLGEPAEFGELMKIEKDATAESLTKLSRPNITIKVDSISEETMGEMVMMLMRSVAFLGELMGVNPFDQPGVEYTKKLIKENVQKLPAN